MVWNSYGGSSGTLIQIGSARFNWFSLLLLDQLTLTSSTTSKECTFAFFWNLKEGGRQTQRERET